MRKLLSIWLVLTSIICIGQNENITIKGRIIGDVPERIAIAIPTQGYYFWDFAKWVRPDSQGNFQISFYSSTPCFVNIYNTTVDPIIIAEPENIYEIEINQTDEEFITKSNLKPIQDYYSKLIRMNPRACVNPLSNHVDSTGTEVELIREKLKEELLFFSNCLRNEQISQTVFDLVKLDREVYYLAMIATITSRNYLALKDNQTRANEVLEEWKKIFLEIPLATSGLLTTNYAYDLIDYYFWLQFYTLYTDENLKDEFKENRKEYVRKDLRHTHNLMLASQFLNEPILEYYRAAYLKINLFRGTRELLDLMKKFKQDYPESIYLVYLEPIIERITSKLEDSN